MSDGAAIDYLGMAAWPMFVGFTTSRKAFTAEMARLRVDPEPPFHACEASGATTHLLTLDSETTCIITMTVRKKRTPEQVAALIAHEAVHAVQYLWEAIGERNPGKEAEAYLVQHIVQGCLQLAWKTGRDRKRLPG